MDPPILQEIYKHQFKPQKCMEATAVWNNNKLAVRVDKEIFLLEVGNSLNPDIKVLDVAISSISCPTTSFATKVLLGYKSDLLPMIKFVEINTDPGLLAYNPELVKDVAIFTSVEWSPLPLYSNQNVIATLTNFGRIDIFGREKRDWVIVLKLSEVIDKIYDFEYIADDFEANKNAAYTLLTNAYCWGPSNGTSSFLITAQRNGEILFWSIKNEAGNLQAHLFSKTNTDASIAHLFFIPLSDNNFILLYATIMGELYSLHCCTDNDGVSFTNVACLWGHKDRMVVQHLKYTLMENKLIFLFVKHKHLVTLSYNEKDPEKSDLKYSIVNDERVTCLTGETSFYLSTEDFKLYKVDIVLNENAAEAITTLVEFRDSSYSDHNLYNVSVSQSGSIFALCTLERNPLYRTKPISINIILFETEEDEILKILSNTTRDLANVWDSIEVLRYKCFKKKIWPLIDYTQLYAEAQTDMYKLKVYLEMLKFLNKMRTIRSVSFGPEMPEFCEEAVKDLILFKHAHELLKSILQIYESDGKLTEIQRDSLYFIKDFLEFYSKKYNCPKTVKDEVFNVVPFGNYECQCCDEKYKGQWYGSSHINVMCSLTFTQINSLDYLYCPRCNVTARVELFEESPSCTFCDTILLKT